MPKNIRIGIQPRVEPSVTEAGSRAKQTNMMGANNTMTQVERTWAARWSCRRRSPLMMQGTRTCSVDGIGASIALNLDGRQHHGNHDDDGRTVFQTTNVPCFFATVIVARVPALNSRKSDSMPSLKITALSAVWETRVKG